IFAGRPAWGSWAVYGLGSERRELPAYVVLSDPGGLPVDGTNNWSSGFLPAVYQGTPFRATGTPVAHLATPADVTAGARRNQLDLLHELKDTHSKNAESLRNLCAMTDGPSAGLVLDLKRRGLLDSTIVMWTGEFGRLPISQGADGRDHNRHGFSLWLAGGGFRRGYVHGATD